MVQKRQVERRAAGYDQNGNVHVDFPQLLNEAREAGHRVKGFGEGLRNWYDQREKNHLEREYRRLRIKEQEAETLSQINRLKKKIAEEKAKQY